MAIRNNTSPSPVKAEAKGGAEEALKQWAGANRALLEILIDAYCIVDANNKVVDFNVAFTELCGESYRKTLKIGDFCELLKTEKCPDLCPGKTVLSSGAPLRLDEIGGSSKAFPELAMILSGVPIRDVKNQVIGALLAIRNVSAESELQKKYYERKQESVMDGLTRLYNKVYTETTLLKLVKSSLREPTNLSLILCDIDHFKKVNDTFGHQAGDYVLATVAQMLQGESRESDMVGRFGGEEFIVILANSDQAGALTFAERFRRRVSGTQILFEGKHIPVTISLGTSTYKELWRPGLDPEQSMKELIGRADTALYYAKANGRNQTCQFEALPSNWAGANKQSKTG